MTRLEHLLTIAAEECAEVAQRASKAARFGLSEIQINDVENPKTLSNFERLRLEYTDLVAVLEMINYDLVRVVDRERDAKKTKVEEYLRYAYSVGTLEKFT